MARKSFRKIDGFSQDDMENQYLEVLWQAVQKYDPNAGANFSTFFNLLASNRVRDLVRYTYAKSRMANVGVLSLDFIVEAGEDIYGNEITMQTINVKDLEAATAEVSAEDMACAFETVQEQILSGRKIR